MTAAEVLASAAESLRRDPEAWYRRGTSLATVVANVPGAGLKERGEAAALLRAHLGGDPRNAYSLADWSKVRGHEEAIQALDAAAFAVEARNVYVEAVCVDASCATCRAGEPCH